MRGVIAAAAYVPHHRLDRSEIAAVVGTGGGGGQRAVASYDEDTTTMGVAAAAMALGATQAQPEAVWFATSTPAYLDKTNATAIHAALRLPAGVGAVDMGGALRSGPGTLRAALGARGSTVLVVTADLRDGLPGGADEATAGDAAAALLIGDAPDADGGAPLLAQHLGSAARTIEITERWRLPGETVSRVWEERFTETVYPPAAVEALTEAIQRANISGESIDHLAVTGLSSRATRRATAELARLAPHAKVVDPLQDTVGNTGAAHAGVMLCAALEQASPGEMIAVVALADGAEVMILRTTEALAGHQPQASLRSQIEAGGPVSYGRFLSWRQMLVTEPPNRPTPSRPSTPAAHRRSDWKFGLVGSRDRASQMVHLPPARVSQKGGATDDMAPSPMAQHTGTVAAFTVDRLVYSPSPPVVFAVVDFDGGGRVPLELTDVNAQDVHVGMRVTPTFRRLFTADGVHNYFWKARPVGEPQSPTGAE